MSLAKYFMPLGVNHPGRQVVVYRRGAIVNGAQSGVTTITVFEPHELSSSDKFYVMAPDGGCDTSRIETVSSTAATTITISGSARTFAGNERLVPLGNDSEAAYLDGAITRPALDGSQVTIHTDPAGTNAITNSNVTLTGGKVLQFWGDGSVLWAVTFNEKKEPIHIVEDLGPMNPGGATVDELPATGSPGQHIIVAGPPDTYFQWMRDAGGDYGWTEVFTG